MSEKKRLITIPERLELLWIEKYTKPKPKLEPRILIEDPEKSYGDKNSESMLIFGDNLLVLQSPAQGLSGQAGYHHR